MENVFLLIGLFIIACVLIPKKKVAVVNEVKKSNPLKAYIPFIMDDEALFLGITNDAVENVNIYIINNVDVKSLEKDYKVIKIIKTPKDLITMLNYQGYKGNIVREELLAYVEDNCYYNIIDYLKTRITI